MTERDSLLNNVEKHSSELDVLEERNFFDRVLRPCLGEFVATTLFVFIGTMSVAGTGGVLGVAVAHGLAIALLVAAFGTISGGHLNPAVTLGVACSGGIGPLLAVLYVVSQLMGGILGAALTRGVLSKGVFVGISGGATLLAEGTSLSEGLLCEVMLTSILVLTVILTAVDNGTKSPLAPLAIGFAVVVCILAGASVSGASLNPARSLGPAIATAVYSTSVWTDHWLYYVGPGLGAILASVLYRLFFASSDKRLIARS